MSSSHVYPEDLCYAPCWQRLFRALAACLMPLPGHRVDEGGPAGSGGDLAAAGAGVTSGERREEGEMKEEAPLREEEERREEAKLALGLLKQLAGECVGNSPLHAAHLLLSLDQASREGQDIGFPHILFHATELSKLPTISHQSNPLSTQPLRIISIKLLPPLPPPVETPSTSIPSTSTPSTSIPSTSSPPETPLQRLEARYPLEVELIRQSHRLLACLAKDWHLLKGPERARLAAFVCGAVIAAPLEKEQQRKRRRTLAGETGPPLWGLGQVLVLLDAGMAWWRRLTSGEAARGVYAMWLCALILFLYLLCAA